MASAGLIWDLVARDNASPGFLRVAGAADKAATSTARASASMRASTAKMGALGANLTKKLTLPILAIGAVATDQAMKYQKSLNTIAVATDQTSAQMQKSSKGLLTIAKSTGTSLDQLTTALYTVEKGGLRGQHALDAVKAAAQGAKAENADLGTVTNALTSIMASYGKQLSNPVAAMNMIIRGAGLAKTTMQDFSDSLSNVVPLASSLHISFAQVAGAIDTMTQHGETAQRATDNLSNLITNLAGQNNVASQSLQQLGVNTISLSKNLGKAGLTGSLNTVLDAVAKHGKDGLVVTSAFKQAATATRSLHTELAAMPKALQTNATAFDKGKMSYKDFYAYAKSLGGQQYQMAKGFIATEATAKGFNNQLKSGNSTVRTLASTLQKSLGGVTGMRVALMLSGSSAQTFAEDTKAVGRAALSAGSDVLGWNKTQDTLAVKMDKAKESLQVMAVEIGTALIPAVSKIADAVAKAVGWFQNLSGTQKKMLLWSAGIVAAVGPVMAILSRIAILGRGVSGALGIAGKGAVSLYRIVQGARAAELSIQAMDTASYGAGLRIRQAFTAIGTAVRNPTQAFRALQASGVIGVAAITAVGVAGYALGRAMSSAIEKSNAWAHTMDNLGAQAKSWEQALLAANGAVDQSTRLTVALALQQNGLAAKAAKAGVSLGQLTSGVTGGKRAMDQLIATWKASGAPSDNTIATLEIMGAKFRQVATDAKSAAAAANIPKAITVRDNATTVLAKIKAAIAALQSKTITIDAYEKIVGITGAGGSAESQGGKGRSSRATGGWLRGPGTGTSDSILARVSNGEYIVRASQAKKHASLLQRINTPGYASGGKVDQSTLSSKVSTSIGNIGAAAGSKFLVVDVGIDRIRHQLDAARKMLATEIGKGLSANAAKAYRAELKKYTALAQKQLASLRVKINTTDLNTIKSALTDSASSLRDAFTTIIADARKAGKNIKPYQIAEAKLLTQQKSYLSSANRLATMKQFQTDTRSTLSGTFDPTQYGSVTDLITGLSGATGTNNAYASEVNKLRGEAKGNSGLLGFINQLAASGQSATLQTLSSANKGQLAQVATAVGGYNSSLTAGSQAAVLAEYGKSVAQQTTATTDLKNEMGKLVASLKARKPVHLHVHLNGKEISHEVISSDEFEHVFDTLASSIQHGQRKGA